MAFDKIGLPRLSSEALPDRSAVALGAVPPAVVGVGAALGGLYALGKRQAEVKKAEAHHAHPTFAPVPQQLWTPGVHEAVPQGIPTAPAPPRPVLPPLPAPPFPVAPASPAAPPLPVSPPVMTPSSRAPRTRLRSGARNLMGSSR